MLAVSYKYEGMLEEDELDDSPKRGLHVKDGILDTTTLVEIIVLNTKQIDKLTNLIFNTDYKKKWEFYTIDAGKCFEPRNALIFVDAKGIVLDYLQICFSCKQNYSKSDKFDIGVLCNDKYQLFSDYFKNVGVSYGTLGKDYREEDNKEWTELRKLRSAKP